MEAPHRRMRIPGSLGTMPVKNTDQLIRIFGKIRQFYGAILEKGNRLCRILHAHHDVETRFAHFCNAPLHRRVNDVNHTAAPFIHLVPAKSKAGHHVMQLRHTMVVFTHVILGKFDHQQRCRTPSYRLLNNGPENGNGARQLNHRVVDQLDSHRIKRDKMLGRIHRFVKTRKMADTHQFLRWQWP